MIIERMKVYRAPAEDTSDGYLYRQATSAEKMLAFFRTQCDLPALKAEQLQVLIESEFAPVTTVPVEDGGIQDGPQAARDAAVEAMLAALEKIADLEMGRGDGAVDDYIDEVLDTARTAIAAAKAAGIGAGK